MSTPTSSPTKTKSTHSSVFVPREPPGTIHWLANADTPRGVQLDTVTGRYSSEDGQLRTIVGAPVNEKQRVTATGTPVTLTYSGQTTASFANTATPTQVQTVLENLSNLAVGDVYVTGAIQNEKQTITIGGAATGGTFPITLDGQTTLSPFISRNASASTVQARLQALTTIGSEGCSVTGPTGGPWVVEFTGPHAGVNMNTMTSSNTNLTPSGTVTITTTQTGSTGTPWTVNFLGNLASTNVAQMTATNATVETVTAGDPVLGVKLVANTPLLELDQLVYDVYFTVPDLDPLRVDRPINPFGFVAPTTGGSTLDLAAVAKIPPRTLPRRR